MSKAYAWLQIIMSTYFFVAFIMYLPSWGVPPGTTGVQGIFGQMYSFLNLIVVLTWFYLWTMIGD